MQKCLHDPFNNVKSQRLEHQTTIIYLFPRRSLLSIANSVGLDEMPHFVTSHLTLHFQCAILVLCNIKMVTTGNFVLKMLF